ncbi:hypothetical protein XELAEV_18033737mg [Xenopus laevis]|uniref:Uncharacterized protein n=1 Tax=Xenopus laevis TaxID=8355 RepID=A0A974HE91_XENLA|nr:hypothetical protein XELAEV_18033737mg [Xenopus laevis]
MQKSTLSKMCKGLTKARVQAKPLKCREGWKTDLLFIMDFQWKEALCAPTHISSYKDRLLQLYMIHRAYYNRDSIIHQMYSSVATTCLRCGAQPATLMHTIWDTVLLWYSTPSL